MPPPLNGINWDEIRNCYMTEVNVSIRQLAERFNVSQATMQKKCAKLGWKRDRDNIELNRQKCVTQISQRVVEKTSERAATQIAKHLETVLTSGNGILAKLQERLEQAIIPDISKLEHLESATRSYRSWDDLVRRAHGLSDKQVDITTGGLPMHERVLSILESCTKLVRDGAVKSVDVDGEALLRELQSSDSTGEGTLSAEPDIEPVK